MFQTRNYEVFSLSYIIIILIFSVYNVILCTALSEDFDENLDAFCSARSKQIETLGKKTKTGLSHITYVFATLRTLIMK